MKHSVAAAALLGALCLVGVLSSEGAHAQAARAADLIVVLDSSGSMDGSIVARRDGALLIDATVSGGAN